MRCAVLDLGTNTFQLLIAEKIDGKIRTIYEESYPVKLGEGGIQNNLITPLAFERGLNALSKFYELMQKHQVQSHLAFATSAIRSANNGKKFIDEAYNKLGISINEIDGDQEATYIYKGVQKSISFLDQTHLVMDIGGGSVELILGNKFEILWKKSFNIGAARLLHPYHQKDPIDQDDLILLSQFLNEQLEPLKEILALYPNYILVGAAGAFESLLNLSGISALSDSATEIPLPVFYHLYNQMIASDLNERKNMKGLVDYRADMMVVAMVLMRTVIDIQQTKQLLISTFSLKEGVLQELL